MARLTGWQTQAWATLSQPSCQPVNRMLSTGANLVNRSFRLTDTTPRLICQPSQPISRVHLAPPAISLLRPRMWPSIRPMAALSAERVTMAEVPHNCPVAGTETPLVELVGLIPSLGICSWWGSWCGACGAVWQGDLQIVPPATGQETYDRGVQAFGYGGSLN